MHLDEQFNDCFAKAACKLGLVLSINLGEGSIACTMYYFATFKSLFS